MNTQTALLDTTLVKVADAKVVNLVPNLATIKRTAPGILRPGRRISRLCPTDF